MNVLIGILITALGTGAVVRVFDRMVARQEKKRQEKEVERYSSGRHVYFNPNPNAEVDKETGEPKRWHTGDCVVRAFCGVLGLSWEEVYDDLCRIGADCRDFPNGPGPIRRYAKEKGLVKRTLPSSVSVAEFAASHDGVYFVLLTSHAICVKNNKLYDCGDFGRSRMRTYYEKGAAPDPSQDRKEVKSHDDLVKALCDALDLPWDTVYSGLCGIARENHEMPNERNTILRYFKNHDLVRRMLRPGMKLSEFTRTYDGTCLVQVTRGSDPLFVCVKDHAIQGHPGYGSRMITSYYERKR